MITSALLLPSLVVAYSAPRLVTLATKQAIAIALAIGIHNGTLAIYIAFNVRGNGMMSVPAAIHSLIMVAAARMFAWWVNRRHAA